MRITVRSFSLLLASLRLVAKNLSIDLQSHGSESYECGGANIVISDGLEYLEGAFTEANKNWQEE